MPSFYSFLRTQWNWTAHEGRSGAQRLTGPDNWSFIPGCDPMILTEVFVVICTTAGTPCINYIDVAQGVLSVTACEHVMQKIARDHVANGAVLHRERSSCTVMPVNTQNDLVS